MKKRALLFAIQSNFVEKLDQNVIATGLKLLDYETTVLTKKEFVEKSKELDFSKFDAIFFPIQFSAMHSSTRGYFEAIEKLMEEAKDDSLYSYVCDTSLVPNPHLWKYGDKEYKTKQNLYAKRPVTHLACFKDAILKDEQAMNRLHNLWMKRSHPESKLYMLEWTSFYYYCQNSLESMTASTVGIDDLVDYSCNLLYYGGDKPKIARRLKELGIEKDPNNLVFGTIGKILPNVRQVLPKMNVNGYDWKKYAEKANKVIFPYEPIKGDYQITLRMMECLLYYKDKVFIDEKLSKDLVPYLTDLDAWKKTAEKTLSRLKLILDGDFSH